MKNKIGLILSGGMDSSCLAWWLKPQVAITIDYGQKAAKAEIDASSLICSTLGIEHHLIKVDCRSLGSGIWQEPLPTLMLQQVIGGRTAINY